MEARSATGPAATTAAEDVARYKNDQKVSQAKAEHLEELRDGFAKHGPPLGLGITLLQISIALASVCLLTKRKALWAVAGAIGIAYVIFGLYLV